MVEMTPEHLEAQVEMELQKNEENEAVASGAADTGILDFSARLIDKKVKEEPANDEGPMLPVDVLSLSSLLSQGFEEGPARKALRKHQNNTQAALDWLINGQVEEEEKRKLVSDGVRMPTTVKRVQKLKAMRRAQAEKQKEKEKQNNEDAAQADREKDDKGDTKKEPAKAPSLPPSPAASRDMLSGSPAKPSQAPASLMDFDDKPSGQPSRSAGAGDLLGFDDERPAVPTDFSKPVDLTALPAQLHFDAARCEKQPLSAAVAAGLAHNRTFEYPSPASQGSGLQGLDFGSGQAAPSTAPAAGGAISADLLAAVQALAAQSQVSPEALLRAAQQQLAGAAPAALPAAPMAPSVSTSTGGGWDRIAGISGPAAGALQALDAFSGPTAQSPPKPAAGDAFGDLMNFTSQPKSGGYPGPG